MRSPITTHVLDISAGAPGVEIGVTLERQAAGGEWEALARGVTNIDGRVEGLLPPGSLVPAVYRLMFATGDYFRRRGIASFYPIVTIEFQVIRPDEHYHVPILISPFGYTTYRGS